MSYIFKGPMRCFLNGQELKGVTEISVEPAMNYQDNKSFFVNVNFPVKTIEVVGADIKLGTEET